MAKSALNRYAMFISTAFLLLSIPDSHAGDDSSKWVKRIVSKTEQPLASLINPHESNVNVIIVDGKRFDHVRGLRSFYLPAPSINSIVFIADAKDYSVVYHVFNMGTREDIAIRAPSSMFGRTIGANASRDRIEKAEGQTLVLCVIDPDAKSTLPTLSKLSTVKSFYYLDLANRTVREKTLYLDSSGKVILERP
jgi:hypothetical protein